MTSLRLEDLHVSLGPYQILQGVSLQVPEGDLTLLLGRNGAGKSSTLRSVMKLMAPSRGRIVIGGRDVTAYPTHDVSTLGVGYVPEHRAVFPTLTVEENLRIAERSDGEFEERREWIYELFPDLQRLNRLRGGQLSGGQQQMVSIARALVPRNSLFLVDEPFEGLAPFLVQDLIEVFSEIAKDSTVLMVEQDFRSLSDIATSYSIVAEGRSVASGTISELFQDETLLRRHLGVAL